MGLVLLPYFFGILFVVAFSVFQTFKFRKEEELKQKIFIGSLFSILILFVTNLIYANSKEAYAFGPFFLIPLITIILPFIIAQILKLVTIKRFQIIGHSLVISVIISTLLMLVFYKYLDVFERFNLSTYH